MKKTGRPLKFIRLEREVMQRWLDVVKAKLLEKSLNADDNVEIGEEWAVVEEMERALKGDG